MSNAEKYLFSDFTHGHYRTILEKACERFEFISYREIREKNEFIIWRHDVDFSMHEAVRLAKIEKEFKIKSTYFILLHSEFYNLLEKEITSKIYELLELGHNIGLHFDASYYDVKSKYDLEKNLIFEKGVLENIFNITVEAFSFHNPTDEILKFVEFGYCNMVNTYSTFLKENVTYCSDSNGYWRFRRMIDVVSDPGTKRLQALTHPEWWTRTPMSPKEKIWKCIDGRAQASKDFYINGLKQFERQLIDW